MMRIDPEISGASIVLLGDMNPAIFHPAWIFANGIEAKVSDELIKIDVCHKDIAKFSVADTHYLVDQSRFQIQTVVAPWIHILDTVRIIFKENLSHTPVRSVGINRDVHFPLKDMETRTKLGRMLAPTAPWGPLGKEMDSDDPTQVGGLLSLTMRTVENGEGFTLMKNIKVEPSAVLKGNSAVYMQANFHYDLSASTGSDAKVFGAVPAVDLLVNEFDRRNNEADLIFDHIMGLV